MRTNCEWHGTIRNRPKHYQRQRQTFFFSLASLFLGSTRKDTAAALISYTPGVSLSENRPRIRRPACWPARTCFGSALRRFARSTIRSSGSTRFTGQSRRAASRSRHSHNSGTIAWLRARRAGPWLAVRFGSRVRLLLRLVGLAERVRKLELFRKRHELPLGEHELSQRKIRRQTRGGATGRISQTAVATAPLSKQSVTTTPPAIHIQRDEDF